MISRPVQVQARALCTQTFLHLCCISGPSIRNHVSNLRSPSSLFKPEFYLTTARCCTGTGIRCVHACQNKKTHIHPNYISDCFITNVVLYQVYHLLLDEVVSPLHCCNNNQEEQPSSEQQQVEEGSKGKERKGKNAIGITASAGNCPPFIPCPTTFTAPFQSYLTFFGCSGLSHFSGFSRKALRKHQ